MNDIRRVRECDSPGMCSDPEGDYVPYECVVPLLDDSAKLKAIREAWDDRKCSDFMAAVKRILSS